MLNIFRSALTICKYGQSTWYANLLSSQFFILKKSPAQTQRTQPSDDLFAALPKCSHFTELHKTCNPRSSTLRRIPTDPADISHCIRQCAHRHAAHQAHQYGVSWQYPPCLKSNTKGHRSDQYKINKVLNDLHVRYPDFGYPQYEEQLRSMGVHYMANVLMFDADFYVAKVGMVEEAAHLLCQWVAPGVGPDILQMRRTSTSCKPADLGADREKENIAH
jgi:hypothetical protein